MRTPDKLLRADAEELERDPPDLTPRELEQYNRILTVAEPIMARRGIHTMTLPGLAQALCMGTANRATAFFRSRCPAGDPAPPAPAETRLRHQQNPARCRGPPAKNARRLPRLHAHGPGRLHRRPPAAGARPPPPAGGPAHQHRGRPPTTSATSSPTASPRTSSPCSTCAPSTPRASKQPSPPSSPPPPSNPSPPRRPPNPPPPPAAIRRSLPGRPAAPARPPGAAPFRSRSHAARRRPPADPFLGLKAGLHPPYLPKPSTSRAPATPSAR